MAYWLFEDGGLFWMMVLFCVSLVFGYPLLLSSRSKHASTYVSDAAPSPNTGFDDLDIALLTFMSKPSVDTAAEVEYQRDWAAGAIEMCCFEGG